MVLQPGTLWLSIYKCSWNKGTKPALLPSHHSWGVAELSWGRVKSGRFEFEGLQTFQSIHIQSCNTKHYNSNTLLLWTAAHCSHSFLICNRMYDVDLKKIRILQVTVVLCNFVKISAITTWKNRVQNIFITETFLTIGIEGTRHWKLIRSTKELLLTHVMNWLKFCNNPILSNSPLQSLVLGTLGHHAYIFLSQCGLQDFF